MQTGDFKIHLNNQYHDTKGLSVKTDLPSDEHPTKTDSEDCPCYDNDQTTGIKRVYLFALIGWIILIITYKLIPPHDAIEIAILFVPIVVFLISYISIPKITYKVERYMFKANLLTLGLLVALPLLNWVNTNRNENRTLFIKLAATAIIFSMLTLIDVWVPCEYLPVVKHIKSVLQTSAITLLIFGLYRFFIEQAKELKDTDKNSSPGENMKSQK